MAPEETPKKRSRWVNWLPVLGFLLIAFWQAILTSESKELDPAPIHYKTEWIPESKRYKPGDLARFKVVLEAERVPISCLRIESLHSVEREESLPATIVYKEVLRKGELVHVNSFRIPLDTPPGFYILEGMLIPYGQRGLEVAPYTSQPFKIVE